MSVDLEGQIEHVTYSSEETGFTVLKVRVRGLRELVSVVGTIIAPTPGETLIMKGEWSNHPQHGRQFKISEYQTKVPATVHGIRKYLGSGLVKGIGPVMAGRIVNRFGEDTLEVIDRQMDRLLEVDGLGPKRLDMIRQAWDDQKEIRQVMVFLQDHGVGSGYASKIYKQYGDRSIDIVRENPYRLAEDIFGIGFRSADKIAERLGLAKDSELRAEAGILHVLHEMAKEGHVFYPYEPLVEKCREILDIDRGIIVKALAVLTGLNKIVIEDLNENLEAFQADNKAVYMIGYHVSEVNVARRLKNLLQATPSIRPVDADKAVDWVQKQLGLDLAARQKEAVWRATQDKILIITGGPGTGKTTIIKAVLAIFSKLTTSIMLAAPTGRAAKRMSEATGYEAKTIHRLLEMNPREGGFKKNERAPLDCDLLIVDEASMIDILLMNHLIKAIPSGSSLILVGDVDQLPSVGPGNVLKDLIASKVIPMVRLDEIFRQAKESSIIVNAHQINHGRMPELTASPDKLEDFYFIERARPEEALKTIIELVAERIPKRFGLDPIEDLQVLSPMHRGLAGAGNLNHELQKRLNPQPNALTRGGVEFRLRDKVMQIRNNYDKEVFNGDIGRIVNLDFERRDVTVQFDERRVIYDFADLDELIQAYAVSVHKSQGSEFPAVILPVLMQHYILLQRNLIYTAVTRGRRLVVMVGDKKALAVALANDRTKRRYTLLARRLE